MEKKLNAKLRNYIKDFKSNTNKYILEKLKINNIDSVIIQDIMNYIYSYENLEFTPQDLQKRKRVKNIVPFHCRCIALRANHDQCTRRRKGDLKFCGTHSKGTPHGVINSVTMEKTHEIKQVIQQEIQGIICHIDNDGNVYDPIDIQQNIDNPKIVAKYLLQNGEYKILN